MAGPLKKQTNKTKLQLTLEQCELGALTPHTVKNLHITFDSPKT